MRRLFVEFFLFDRCAYERKRKHISCRFRKCAGQYISCIETRSQNILRSSIWVRLSVSLRDVQVISVAHCSIIHAMHVGSSSDVTMSYVKRPDASEQRLEYLFTELVDSD
jgi:hypothetical protein